MLQNGPPIYHVCHFPLLWDSQWQGMRSSGKRNAGLSTASTTFSHQFQLQDKASLLCQFQADSKVYTEPSDNLCVLSDSYHVQYYCQQIDLASSSQKSNGMWFFRHFSRHICPTVPETIGVTNYPTSFGSKKCSESHIRSCWYDTWSVEPTKYTYKTLSLNFARSICC